MTIWNSKVAPAAVALMALSGCEEGQGGDLFAGLGQPAAAAKNVALSQSQMADGAFTLVPPEGFCIDKRSLKQRFALLTRCEALAAPGAGGGAPVAILTVSATPNGTSGPLPTPQQTAAAAKLTRFDAAKSSTDAVTFRAGGAPPIRGLDVNHWRGTMRVGGHLVGLALYGPKGGRAVSNEGRSILDSLIRRTRGSNP